MRPEGREKRASRTVKRPKLIFESFKSSIAKIGTLMLFSAATSSAHP
jgi:hypothetical protein